MQLANKKRSTGNPATTDVIDGVGGTVNGRFSIIPAMPATIPSSAINGLQLNPNVDYVEVDGYKDLHPDSSVGELQEATNRIEAEAARANNFCSKARSRIKESARLAVA